MDENDSTVCSRPSPPAFQHLKSLSAYARSIACDKEPSLHHPRNSSNPFCNLKIEVVSSTSKKRKLDESVDDGYETPAEQSFSLRTCSPDLGCIMDYCGTTGNLDLGSSFAIALFHQPVTSRGKCNVSSQEHCAHVQCMSLAGPLGNGETGPHTLQCGNATLNLGSVFDCDVNDILCLSPTDTYAAGDDTDGVEKCKTSSSHIHLNEPVKTPTVSEQPSKNSHKKEVEVVESVQEDQNKETDRDKKDQQVMEQLTVANEKVPKMNPIQSEDPAMPVATSAPLHKVEVSCYICTFMFHTC